MQFLSRSTVVDLVPAQSLDSLWEEAETLGRIEVDHSWKNRDDYRVRIRFERKTGTTVWAEGNDKNIAFAVASAINEAREMGAGAETC